MTIPDDIAMVAREDAYTVTWMGGVTYIRTARWMNGNDIVMGRIEPDGSRVEHIRLVIPPHTPPPPAERLAMLTEEFLPVIAFIAGACIGAATALSFYLAGHP